MHKKSKVTVITVANAIALATSIAERVSGSPVSTTLLGNALTATTLADLMAARIGSRYSNFTGKVVA